MKKFVIKSMTDANKLLKLGHRIIEIDRNKYDRDYLIFIFEDTERFRENLRNLPKSY